MAPINQAAWLHKAGTPLQVGDAPMPTAGPGELVIKNSAVAINPLDTHMQDVGVFVQQWPAIIGCDVAGEVYEVGPGIDGRFKKGDRVVGHAINLTSGRPQDGAFALYTVVPADKTATLPDNISFKDAAVLPLVLEGAICALNVKTPGAAMPGVSTPALGLPYPSLVASSIEKVIIVNGGASSIGAMVIQMAHAAGLKVFAISSKENAYISQVCGAEETFKYTDPDHVDKVVQAIKNSGLEFVGIFDAIATNQTYPNDLSILEKLGGGHLSCTHPPPVDLPANVKAGMIFAVDDVATPVWKDYVTPALASGKLKCLPGPTVVGKGLESIQTALEKYRSGVSATKLVVEL